MNNTVRVRVLRELSVYVDPIDGYDVSGDLSPASVGDVREMTIVEGSIPAVAWVDGEEVAIPGEALCNDDGWELGPGDFEVVDERAEAAAIIEAALSGVISVVRNSYVANPKFNGWLGGTNEHVSGPCDTRVEAAREAYRVLCERRKADHG